MNVKTVGIVGANGNLGQQVALQVCHSFEGELLAFDINRLDPAKIVETAVDRSIRREHVTYDPIFTSSIDELMARCDIVHFCTPARVALEVPHSPRALLVLHESIMSNSVAVAEELTSISAARVGVAHLLMNQAKRAVVATDIGETAEAYDHMARIGLEPLKRSSEEHDTIMAHSQAVLALLARSLLDELRGYDLEGLLTNSAHELLSALGHRESEWTKETLTSIMANPQLPKLIDTLAATVALHQSHK